MISNKTLSLILLMYSFTIFADEKTEKQLDFFVDILGKYGVLGIIGILFFAGSYKYSVNVFQWVEDQTFGTRDYILQKFELLQIDVEPKNITYALIILALVIPVLAFGAFALAGNLLLAAIFGAVMAVIGWKIPRPFMDMLVERRKKIYQDQMVDALNLLANGLRAGLSMPQSIGMVVDELPAPVSQEFNLILQQTKIGVPLDEALENLNKRVYTQDNEMFVTSVGILRETGGNLAEVFDTIIDVIRERLRIQQKIDTYVAQGLIQARIMALMPVGMLGISYASDPDSVMLMFSHPIGIAGLCVAAALDSVGYMVILKMIKIEV